MFLSTVHLLANFSDNSYTYFSESEEVIESFWKNAQIQSFSDNFFQETSSKFSIRSIWKYLD